jgi:phthiocerol/phenolphthiocerol synthesis type-I polyketide synthase B
MRATARPGVAVIGIGCRFPGGITSPAAYWQVLKDGRSVVGKVPFGRFDPGLVPGPGESPVPPFGGYLDGLDQLDAAFFGISPREAERLDPQQRLLLETAWEALEDAGQDPVRLRDAAGGVFVGQWLSDYENRLLSDPGQFDFFMTTGSGRYATSGRLSALLGWRGPSLTVDTACSSSLAAVHLAARSVRDGESRLALACGVNVILEPHVSIAYARSGMLAADGRCKFGDAAADGYVRSEGAAVLVLKGLDDALADGDRIYAVVLGTAMNNDGGSSGSLGTPSLAGQTELLRRALDDAALEPGQIGYVEAHGTGTKAGDPVELAAIGAVLGATRAAGEPILVGSAKTNLGHTEGAAGMAGLIKAILTIRNGLIPASLNCSTPNPAIPWADLRCSLASTASPWPAGRPRIAGTSAFGISGTNAHIVVGEGPQQPNDTPEPPTTADQRACLLPLSARHPQALRDLAARYAKLLRSPGAPTLAAICRNAALRRRAFERRAAFVATDSAAMAEALTRYAAGEAAAAEGLCADGPRTVAFVAPGQGAQWAGMAQQLLATEPSFRAALDRCDAAARPWLGVSICDLIRRPDDPENAALLERIDVIQPTLVALSIAYAALLAACGVAPAAVVGHSMGEIAAAHLAGVLDLEQAMRLICRRSALMARMSGRGAMALVELAPAEARRRIAGHANLLSVAAHNAPRSCVLSGDPAALADVMRGLEAEQVFCRLVKVDVASHSAQMADAAAALVAEFADLAPGRTSTALYATVLGREVAGEDLGSGYWGRNLREPVLFLEAVSAMADDGCDTFIELGPHPVLAAALQQTLPEARPGACGRRGEPDHLSFAALLAQIWVQGVDLDWATVLPGSTSFVALPTYPWQRERHWHASADLRRAGESRRAGADLDAEQRGWVHRLDWRALAPAAQDPGEGPWLVAGEGATAAAIARGLAARGCLVRQDALGQLGDTTRARLIIVASEDPDPYLPVALAQRLPEAIRRPPTWIVTTRAQALADEASDPAGAALWGAARVVAAERPDLALTLVDLVGDDAAAVDVLIGSVLGRAVEPELLIRGARCYGRRLVPAPLATDAARIWRADASYLITGGLGDIGLRLAAAMIERGARRLILMSRTPLPARATWLAAEHDAGTRRRIDVVRALEATGAHIHVASCDVSDETALIRFLDGYAADAWPAIRGVIHAAGTFANGLARDLSRARFEAVLGPKLRGAELLDRLLPDLDDFVLFSSTGAYLPQAGQANYAAANAGLEAVAARRRARGGRAACLAWGVWDGTGLVADAAGRANVAGMERQGYRARPAARAAALFAPLCASDDGVPVVCRMSWNLYRGGTLQNPYLLAEVGADAPGDAHPVDGSALPADPRDRRARVDQIVRAAVGEVLKIAPDRLQRHATLGSMGLNSLIAMELRNRLERALARPISATLAWNYPTIAAIVDHLTNVPGQLESAQSGSAQPDPAPEQPRSGDTDVLIDVTALDGISDEEALAALRRPRIAGGPR